jgi:hypothetical protein
MDNSFDDTEDNIRHPDEVKREQLLQDTRSVFQKEMDEAIYLSFQEVKNQQEISRKYEEQLIQEYNSEVNRRKEIFTKFIFDLNRLIKIDKDVKEIYYIIEPIIDSYCLQYLQVCELDEITYEKIFNLLSKIRTDKSAVEILKIIIIKD